MGNYMSILGPTIVTSLGIILTLFGAIWGGRELIKSNEKQLAAQEKIVTLQEEVKPTVFEFKDGNMVDSKEGEYTHSFELIPHGDKVIPIFQIYVQISPDAIIKKFEVDLQGKVSMYDTLTNENIENNHWRGYRFDNVPAQKIEGILVTDKKPDKMNIHIVPFKK